MDPRIRSRVPSDQVTAATDPTGVHGQQHGHTCVVTASQAAGEIDVANLVSVPAAIVGTRFTLTGFARYRAGERLRAASAGRRGHRTWG
jgi:hypothetical protein